MNKRGYAAIGLDNPKDSINVGAVMRAAGVYEAVFVAVSGTRFGPGPTDTMKHHKHLPLIRTTNVLDLIPYDCVPVAVELVENAIPLPEYQHPERAYYIFGGEDTSLGERVFSKCRDIIYIPTKGCMNLAATVNVVLYDRLAKQMQNFNCREGCHVNK